MTFMDLRMIVASEQLYELFGPVNTEDYKNVPVAYVSFTPEIQPTQSEVEVH